MILDSGNASSSNGYNLLRLRCAKCGTQASGEYTRIEYPEDDGTTTLHYGCARCIDEMCDFVEARIEGMKKLREAGYA